LVVVAERLRAALRPQDLVARFGGDEFVIVCGGIGGTAEAEQHAERLRTALEAPLLVADTVVSLTASVGIAVSRDDSTAESLLRDADTAMYEAKDLGRSRHHVFDGRLRARATDRLLLENELRFALARDELRVVYQPIVEVASGAFVGVESLVRWDHPAFGAVSPAAFIPAAEESGVIVPIGRFVLAQACRQAAAWRRQGFDLKVSVNVSSRQLTDASLRDDVVEALEVSGLPGDRLCVELTESVLMTDAARAARVLRELKQLGLEISVDDFGTGYSSLSYLHRFPLDELKIDREFINGITSYADVGNLVVAMVAMAKALRLRIVGEGVETAEQLARLADLDCDLAQGYLLARPAVPEQVEIDLRANQATVAAGA
jgi:predicted signal transduction protein with EAL and GGDEF domain